MRLTRLAVVSALLSIAPEARPPAQAGARRPAAPAVSESVAATGAARASARMFLGPELIPMGVRMWAIRAVDVSGDGVLDLLGLDDPSGEERLVVRLGTGGGRYSDPRSYRVLPQPRSIAIGDIDADGVLDLAVGSLFGISILRGTGDGAFLPGGNPHSGDGPRRLFRTHGWQCSQALSG